MHQDGPKRKITAEYSIKAETETKEHETPRTKHKREVTGSTLEASQKRTLRVEAVATWKTVETRKAKTMGKKSKTNEKKTQAKKGRSAPKHRGRLC